MDEFVSLVPEKMPGGSHVIGFPSIILPEDTETVNTGDATLKNPITYRVARLVILTKLPDGTCVI